MTKPFPSVPEPRKFGGPQPGSGRKPKPEGEALNKPAQVKLRPAEKEELIARAQEANTSVSNYIRVQLGFPPA